MDNVKKEIITLPDGRRAERHVHVNEHGNEVVEIFAEEPRPMKLEKRVEKVMKEVIAEEITQTVVDGKVVHEEVKSNDVDVPLKVVSCLGTADHAKIVNGDYVKADDVNNMVADAVVAGMAALMEDHQPVVHHECHHEEEAPAIFANSLDAQNQVVNNVANKKKNDGWLNIALVAMIGVQLLFFGYMYFVMG